MLKILRYSMFTRNTVKKIRSHFFQVRALSKSEDVSVYSFRFLNGFIVYNCVCIYCFLVLVFVRASRKADLQHYKDSQSYGWYSEEREGV